MPELPEVETVRVGQTPIVSGQQVVRVQVLHPRAVRRHHAGRTDFAARLRHRTFGVPGRRGKYLWLPLDDGLAVVAHLGMSGQFRVALHSADSAVPNDAHLRVRITIAEGRSGAEQDLLFIDQRTFGGLYLDELDASNVPRSLGHIGLDPFDPDFHLTAAVEVLRRRRQHVKRALLDQTLVSGIGNIYADEALWHAKLHYARSTDRLSRKQGTEVLTAAKQVMSAALAEGGTSFDALYVNVNGESGYFERSLQVYGREGQPCLRCGGQIRRAAFTNRSSYYCPRCQRAPRG